MKKKAIIISLNGLKLTKTEKKIFTHHLPWGVILFSRNIKNYLQLKKLIFSIKKITKDKRYPILIDEEGGSVSRLYRIIDNDLYSQKYFGNIFKINHSIGLCLYKKYSDKICKILKTLGININTIPVLDMSYNFTNKFLKNRTYSSNKNSIKLMSNICIKTYKKNKISTVIKHIPGHGLATSDSHKKLPIVTKGIDYLLKNDFKCFKNNNSLFAMTAHVMFKKIDSKNCATHSKEIILNYIRKKLRFKGIIISDDIGMKSLKFDLVENALRSLSAGCNLALYCNGKPKESLKLLKNIPPIDEFTKKKTSEFYKFLR